ncbi:MAG: response regulator [Alphaproteobacteria bacterium]|nr:response regulator [Alphaproteobacteria bacterium]
MSMEMPHILVVDDDTRLRDLLGRYLGENGFRVTTARDAGDARTRLAHFAFDLLILDVMMPGEDGVALTRALRRDSAVPILLLTAKGEADDRIAGLEAGADDYLAKPFEPRELVLRIATILRRSQRPATPAEIRIGAFAFDLAREELRRGEKTVRLTSVEASVLRILAESAGTILSREDLIRRSRIDGNERTVDVQITRLRRKIEPDPRTPRYLVTVRGAGYVLRPD